MAEISNWHIQLSTPLKKCSFIGQFLIEFNTQCWIKAWIYENIIYAHFRMFILFCMVVKNFTTVGFFLVRVDLGSHGVQIVFVAGTRLLSNKMATCIKSTTPKWRSTSTKPTTSLNSRKYNWRSSLANSTMHSKGKRSPGSKQVRFFSCVGCLNMAQSSVCFCLSLTTIGVVQEQILDLEGSYTWGIMSGYPSIILGRIHVQLWKKIIVGFWHVGIEKQRKKKCHWVEMRWSTIPTFEDIWHPWRQWMQLAYFIKNASISWRTKFVWSWQL